MLRTYEGVAGSWIRHARAVPNALIAISKALVLCSGLALLSGCSAMETSPIDSAVQQTAGSKEHTIFAATTRQKDQASLFSGERSPVLNFSVANILVPPTHKGGATDFAIRNASYMDHDKIFLTAINKELRTRPRGKRKLLLFIHGYNTNFVDGLFRLTQLVHDVQSPAVPVLFSWASRASLTNYVYDLNSATIARDDLERTIRLVFQSEAEEVNVVAHSMGNWVTVEAIRQISISGNRPPVEKLGHIILAAPDIDVDVFKSQMRRIGAPKRPYLVMISRDDLALRVSSLLAGGQKRIGAAEDTAELTALGAVVVDLSDISSSDTMGHGKFADLASIGSDLPAVLQRGMNSSAANRPGGVIGATMTLPLAVLGAPIKFISGQR